MNTTIKKGRGRPKGATSTTIITLGELLAKIGNNPEVKVQVGRVWLNKLGITFVPTSSQDGDAIPEGIQSKNEEEPIEFSITH